MCRRKKILWYILLGLAVSAIVALLFPVWLIIVLLVLLVVVLGILCIRG